MSYRRRSSHPHLSQIFAALAAVLALSGLACSRKAPEPIRRLAVLRFENMGADPSEDWIGRALADIVTTQLAADPNLSVIPASAIHALDRAVGSALTAAPGISAERAEALLAGANRLGYGEYRVANGVLTARLTIGNPTTHRDEMAVETSGQDLFAVASELARRLGAAGAYGTKDRNAVRHYVATMESDSPDAALAELQSAAAADPAFAPPQLLLAQMKLNRQDRAGAESILRDAARYAASMPPLDRARLELETASLRGDREGRKRGLEALVKASPNDPAAWKAVAEAAVARRDFNTGVEAYRKAVAIEPGDVLALNTMGYAAASAGDLKTAVEALGRYRELRPNEANPLDSLGDVHLQSGRFREAEDFYLQANRKDAAFLGGGTLYKAAVARLMTGDVAGADEIAKKYIEARQAAKDPALEYRKAEWSWLSGRRREAYRRMEVWAASAASGPLRELAARAYAELGIWSLALGDRAAAEKMVARAQPLSGPASAAVVSVARFLTMPPASSSEWAVRAERAYPDPRQSQIKRFARVYALLLAKEYGPAAALLREMLESEAPIGESAAPVLLGWAYLETGRTAEAARLLAVYPIPNPDGSGPFAVMHFPRILYLRGLLAEKQGRSEAAKLEYRTFLQLSGAAPLQWGEEQRAAK